MGIACDISEEPQHEATKNPKQKATPSGRPHPRPPQLPEARGTTPDLGHYTRSGALHPNRRGALPTDRVQRPNTQEQTRNWRTEPLPVTTSNPHNTRSTKPDQASRPRLKWLPGRAAWSFPIMLSASCRTFTMRFRHLRGRRKWWMGICARYTPIFDICRISPCEDGRGPISMVLSQTPSRPAPWESVSISV